MEVVDGKFFAPRLCLPPASVSSTGLEAVFGNSNGVYISAVSYKSYCGLKSVTVVEVTQQHCNTFGDFHPPAVRKNLQVKAERTFFRDDVESVCRLIRDLSGEQPSCRKTKAELI